MPHKDFFETFERLIREHSITIDRPKGTAHPRFPDLIYPINYGYINNTQSQDGEGIDVFLGDDDARVVGIICTVDTADSSILDYEQIACGSGECVRPETKGEK
jgi:inorganic pyrophosphatase